jgi:transaldolase
MSRLNAIAPLGQQIWLDNLTRQLLDSGELARWIADDAIAGVTSNPAIFYNAIRTDTGTLAAARRLWQEIDRPNAMIKIPATGAGLSAIADAVAEGINVNVTLIFGPAQLAAVQAAYRAGIERRFAAGLPVDRIASVASVFISRLDSLLDARLPAELQGKTAIAFARNEYARWRRQHRSRRRPPADAALGVDLDQESGLP